MAKDKEKDLHVFKDVGIFSDRKVVHDEDHKEKGWVDKNGEVHKVGDSGTLLNDPETIGHVDEDGNVELDDN